MICWRAIEGIKGAMMKQQGKHSYSVAAGLVALACVISGPVSANCLLYTSDAADD